MITFDRSFLFMTMKGKLMKTKTKEMTPTPGINKTGRTRLAAIFRWHLLLALLILPQMVQAQWTATVGAQTDDKGIQALAFLPNEIWIHAGDRITWTFQADEMHTVTFLMAGQVRPDFNVGCPGFSSDPAIFDGSTCVTTPAMVTGQTFTVIFPAAGNFKLTCLVHVNMDGRIHVLPVGDPLPHTQAFYDEQAASHTDELLSEGAKMKPLHDPNSPLGVTAGDHRYHRNGGRHRNRGGCAFFPREYPNPCRSNGRMG